MNRIHADNMVSQPARTVLEFLNELVLFQREVNLHLQKSYFVHEQQIFVLES